MTVAHAASGSLKSTRNSPASSLVFLFDRRQQYLPTKQQIPSLSLCALQVNMSGITSFVLLCRAAGWKTNSCLFAKQLIIKTVMQTYGNRQRRLMVWAHSSGRYRGRQMSVPFCTMKLATQQRMALVLGQTSPRWYRKPRWQNMLPALMPGFSQRGWRRGRRGVFKSLKLLGKICFSSDPSLPYTSWSSTCDTGIVLHAVWKKRRDTSVCLSLQTQTDTRALK